jgi:hypothetical protein
MFHPAFAWKDGLINELRRTSFLFVLNLVIMAFNFSPNQLAFALIFFMPFQVRFSPIRIEWYIACFVSYSNISKGQAMWYPKIYDR